MSDVSGRTPRVSIGMPVYNGERFLLKTMDSLLAQTLEDFELIISDNASTDATGDICRDYAARDARVRYVAQAVNRGATWNDNHLLTLARAPYFTWAHADDLRAPRHLERCVVELDRAPSSVVAAYTRCTFIDEEDRPGGPCPDRMDLRQPRPSNRLRSAMRGSGWCNVLFGAIRTSALRACRPMGNYPFSDLVLVHELALRGQIWEIPDPAFYRRTHPPLTNADTAVYMDPQNAGKLFLPSCRVFLETMRAVRAADLPWSEAARCRATLLCEWLPSKWPDIRHELKCAVRSRVRRFRSPDGIASSARRIRTGRTGVRAPVALPCRVESAGGLAGRRHADANSH